MISENDIMIEDEESDTWAQSKNEFHSIYSVSKDTSFGASSIGPNNMQNISATQDMTRNVVEAPAKNGSSTRRREDNSFVKDMKQGPSQFDWFQDTLFYSATKGDSERPYLGIPEGSPRKPEEKACWAVLTGDSNMRNLFYTMKALLERSSTAKKSATNGGRARKSIKSGRRVILPFVSHKKSFICDVPQWADNVMVVQPLEPKTGKAAFTRPIVISLRFVQRFEDLQRALFLPKEARCRSTFRDASERRVAREKKIRAIEKAKAENGGKYIKGDWGKLVKLKQELSEKIDSLQSSSRKVTRFRTLAEVK